MKPRSPAHASPESARMHATRSWQRTLNFEKGHGWSTAPLELDALMENDGVTEADLWCAQSFDDDCWNLKAIRLRSLAGGLTLSAKHVKHGKTSGRWRNLPLYPTLATDRIPHDWSGCAALGFWIYSTGITGDTITVGLLSDNDQTPWKDFLVSRFQIDWRGWKKIILPLKTLDRLGTPIGLHKIDALYFFAKAYGHHPNPYTELYFDRVSLETRVARHAPAPAPAPAGDRFRYELAHQDVMEPAAFNHPYPEKKGAGPEVTATAFITHQTYHRKERALYKYYPRFASGYVSVSPLGKAYVYSGDVIQWLDNDKRWQMTSLKATLAQWARKQGWKGLRNCWGAQGGDPMLRFDREGNVYALAAVTRLGPDGAEVDWRQRTTLLLHSRDACGTWTVYRLPGRIASFEKLDGHNHECLERPPVILMSDYKHFADADQDATLLIPQKKKNGSLKLPPPVKYAEDCIGVNYHSGDGNIAITHGGKIFLVYGWTPAEIAYPEIAKSLAADGKKGWTLSNLRGTAVAKTLPPIPDHHAGMQMSFPYRMHKDRSSDYPTAFSRDGVPTFVRSYDLGTGTLGDPVYIGSGGGSLDGHNWPAITVDSKGILHVLINGHHNPFVYTHTLKPDDISAWSKPRYIKTGRQSPYLSYATLNCDRHDTLYSVHRSTTACYNNRLVLYRKKSGKPWEGERSLVAPFKGLYFAWRHRMTYDAFLDRLILTYYSSGSMSSLSCDMYEFLIFYRPEQEMILRKTNPVLKPMVKSPYWDSWTHSMIMLPRSGELTSLISSNGGEDWCLLTTPALQTAGPISIPSCQGSQ